MPAINEVLMICSQYVVRHVVQASQNYNIVRVSTAMCLSSCSFSWLSCKRMRYKQKIGHSDPGQSIITTKY